MSSNMYTYKEILLGLRNEYVKMNQELDALKKYIYFANKGFNDYYFDLVKYPNHRPELRLVKKEDDLSKITMFFRKIHSNDPNCAMMVKNNNGEYFPLRKSYHHDKDFVILVMPDKISEFNDAVEEVLSSDFAQKMSFGSIYLSNPDKAVPRLVPSSYDYNLVTDRSEIKYVGRSDELIFSGIKKFGEKNKPLTKEYFNSIMGIEFPRYLFDEYHRELIENSSDVSRDFSLSSTYRPDISSTFEFQDRMYKLVLMKKDK